LNFTAATASRGHLVANSPPVSLVVLSFAGTAALWIVLTWLFWTGYAGADDLSYARYAYFFDRPPFTWWEFRLPAVLAIRASFSLFGPSEFAAALPSLISSLAIVASVAWVVGWPKILTWESQIAVLLAVSMPIDVGFRSYPAAPMMAASLLSLGTAAVLKGRGPTPYLGALLLGLGFLTHEISFFYIALFSFVAVAIEPRRFWRPVLCCVIVSAALLTIESVAYAAWLGDPLARFKTAAHTTTRGATHGLDPDGLMTNVAFLLWPLQNLLYCKQFGVTLGAFFLFGAVTWQKLSQDQRILLATTLATWAWLGYGSQVPWDYKPLYRQFHYYSPLVLGIASGLPRAMTAALRGKGRLVAWLMAGTFAVQIISMAGGGRWGAAVDVSRRLLSYARTHPSVGFLTDIETLNHMYVLNGFKLPANVVALRTPFVEGRLIVNWQPPDVQRLHFPPTVINAVLMNREQAAQHPYEPEFRAYTETLYGTTETVDVVRYKPLFALVTRVTSPRSFMVQSLGADAIYLPAGERTNDPIPPPP